uniref:Uncharacterized protein AlNc14C36G3207 n=1 Tax=Albugo laibachii Nc14 TaxID=890382 RepID=F0W8T3_9STRA|nr:conserved hypothetical protein [Albugo laibachii Nc14]|eukprot:CCA17542.1 conserved hypothetical protein [Albugo laibachii Nc14]
MSDTRSIYKRLIRLAKSLPAEKQAATLLNIRTEFRKHRDISDPTQLSQLLERAQSTIGYLKIVTPHKRSDSGVKRFMFKDGERIEENLKASERARFKVQDIGEGLKRHHQLLRRQHFMDR